MTEQSSGRGRDDWNRDDYVPGEQYYDEGESDSGATRQHPVTPRPSAPSGYGYGSSEQGDQGYGSSAQGDSGYGSSGQSASGFTAGATRGLISNAAHGKPLPRLFAVVIMSGRTS